MPSLKDQLRPLIYPDSIAVIGASPNISKWGSFLLASLIKGGYKRPIFPINPREKFIFGRPCYASLQQVSDPVDLAIIALPLAKVKQAVHDCIEKGVGGIILITSGFSESDAAGENFEREIVSMVRDAGIRMIGPNTMGLINTRHDFIVSASYVRPPRGAISLISQSGNLGSQVLQWAESMGIGIDKFIGSGNEGDVNLTELIEYLHQDEYTKIILVYFEGVDDGRRFLEVASRVSLDKPIIALKGGRTDAGRRAAKSHTGSLAGANDVTMGALKQAGVIVADNPTELIDFSVAFEHLPLPKGNRVGVFTLGGGWGVIAADECNERGFVLPDLPPDIIEELDKLLPNFWSRGNPVDLVGMFDPNLHHRAITMLAASDRFDSVIALGGLGSSHFISRTVANARDIDPAFNQSMVNLAISEAAKLEARHLRDVGETVQTYGKPILTVSHAEKLNYAIPIDDKVVVAYPTPEKVTRVLQMMLWYQNWLAERKPSHAGS